MQSGAIGINSLYMHLLSYKILIRSVNCKVTNEGHFYSGLIGKDALWFCTVLKTLLIFLKGKTKAAIPTCGSKAAFIVQ